MQHDLVQSVLIRCTCTNDEAMIALDSRIELGDFFKKGKGHLCISRRPVTAEPMAPIRPINPHPLRLLRFDGLDANVSPSATAPFCLPFPSFLPRTALPGACCLPRKGFRGFPPIAFVQANTPSRKPYQVGKIMQRDGGGIKQVSSATSLPGSGCIHLPLRLSNTSSVV